MKDIGNERVVLQPIRQDDLQLLHRWRNDEDYCRLCSIRRSEIDYSKFVLELERDFKNDRHEQFLIFEKDRQEAIGTIFSYNLNRTDGYAFITLYLEKPYRGRGRGIEAAIIFCKYLFQKFGLYKIYFETYSYNRFSLNILRKIGITEEGCFKGHRFLEGKRYDLFRFAAFSEDIGKTEDLLRRLREVR